MLTLSEALTLAMRQPKSPWNTADFRRLANVDQFKVSSLIDGVTRQRWAIWFKVARAKSLPWNGIRTVQDLHQAVLQAASPTRQDLIDFASVLKPSGLALMLSKKTWDTVGVYGSADQFGNTPGVQITEANLFHIGQGEATIGTGIGVVGGLLGMPLVVAFGAGFAIGGGIVMIIGAMDEDPPPPPPPPKVSEEEGPADGEQIDFQDGNIGDAPADVANAMAANPGDWIDQFGVEDPAADIPAGEPAGGGPDGGDVGMARARIKPR